MTAGNPPRTVTKLAAGLPLDRDHLRRQIRDELKRMLADESLSPRDRARAEKLLRRLTLTQRDVQRLCLWLGEVLELEGSRPLQDDPLTVHQAIEAEADK